MTPDSLVPGVHALVLLLRRRGADLLRGCPAAGRKVKSRGTTTIAALPRGLRARSEPHALCAQYSAIYCTLHITHRCVCTPCVDIPTHKPYCHAFDLLTMCRCRTRAPRARLDLWHGRREGWCQRSGSGGEV